MCISVCVCVCVCMREREREGWRDGEREKRRGVRAGRGLNSMWVNSIPGERRIAAGDESGREFFLNSGLGTTLSWECW